MKRILSTILVVVLVVSSSGGAVAVTDVPAGMVGVPDANISEDVPVDSSPPLQASELEGSVMTDEYAESLEVIVTTPDRASDYLDDGTELSGSKGLSLVLQDEVHSAGRTVAIDAGAVKDALGYTPERVYGTHEDGEEWSRDIEYQGGMLMFEVPHFSSNSVTFSSEVSVTGTYTDGSSASYSVSSLDAASNLSANVTGHPTTEWDNSSGGPLSTGGDSISISPAGTTDPPTTTLTISETSKESRYHDFDSNTNSYTFSNPPAQVDFVQADVQNVGSQEQDITLVVEVGGTQVASKSTTLPADYSSQIQIDGIDAETNGDSVTLKMASSAGELYGAGDATIESDLPSPTVSTGSGSVDFGTVSDSQTEEIPVSLSDSSISVDYVQGSIGSWSLQMKERSETVDPSIEVNGYSATHSGTLADGETASLSVDDSWIQSGTNTVDISVGSGSLSDDAPSPTVELDYRHDAQDEQTVEFEGTKWTEGYNVSKTFASDRSSASLTIPFQNDVVEIESLETRTNGGSWSSVSQDDYTLNNTELTVHLGAVSGGDEVQVKTTGQKVLSVNSSVTVLEPTAPGGRLDTRVRVDEWNDDSSISVGRTEDAGRIHYIYNESWEDADEHVVITSGGTQQLYLPGADSLSEFNVRTVPVRVNARSGEVNISMRNPSTTEPSFYVSPGVSANDDIEYTLLTAADGEEYILRSETNNVVRDSATANSPVTLVDDDSEELLIIEQDSTTSSADDGPSAVGIGPATIDTDSPLNSVPVILLVGAVILVGLVFIYRRLGWSVRDAAGPIPVDPVFALAAGLIAFVVIDYVGGGALTSALATNIEQIGSGISQIVPLAGIIGVALAAYWVYQNFILGDSGGGGSGSSRVRTVVLREDDGGKK